MGSTALDRIAIVGASLAGLEAAKELRRSGFTGELVVFGKEPNLPYDRPPLSKELLAGTFRIDQVWLPLGDAIDAEWRLGVTVTGLRAADRLLEVDGGTEAFDGIVIATGAAPIRPRFVSEVDLDGIHVLRTLDDSLALAKDLHSVPGRVLVVGGGFIGAEVASTCRGLGLEVTVVEGQTAPMERALGQEIGHALGEVQRDHGVDLRLSTTVTDVGGSERVAWARLSDGSTLHVDVVVVAVGVEPATAWLEGSGLTLDRGVVCDDTCLAAPGVAAAGDVAVWPNRRFGEVRRIEHWDNAIRQGRHAAQRLLAGDDPGAAHRYEPVPWVWSDQFGSKLQVIGSALDHDESQMVVGGLGERRFVAAFRRGDRLVAAIALNSPRTVVQSRRLLQENASWSDAIQHLEQR